MRTGKDSPEVMKFRALFATLKEWCDNEPESLPSLAENDESVKKLCNELGTAAFFFELNERRHRELFTGPVDPKFIAEWRDYEERFQGVLATIWLTDYRHLLEPANPSDATKGSPVTKADMMWEIADDDAGNRQVQFKAQLILLLSRWAKSGATLAKAFASALKTAQPPGTVCRSRPGLICAECSDADSWSLSCLFLVILLRSREALKRCPC
jgi:hypothetical protein